MPIRHQIIASSSTSHPQTANGRLLLRSVLLGLLRTSYSAAAVSEIRIIATDSTGSIRGISLAIINILVAVILRLVAGEED
jgi:hypothetical protein